MNRRANVYLNSFEFLFYSISMLLIGIYLTLENGFLEKLVFSIGALLGLFTIAIELFLFILKKKQIKGIYIGYMIINIVVAVYINSKIPYSGFLVFLVFSLIKDTMRILFVKEIYIPKEFDYYCKMFHIKIKDFKKSKAKTKKRVVSTTTPKEKKEKVYTPKEATI